MMHDLRIVFRQWTADPGFALVSLLTLALGIGANTAVFTLARGVLLDPLPWPDAHRVSSVWEGNPAKGHSRTPVAPAQFVDLRRETKAFAALAGWNTTAIQLAAEGGPAERFQGAAVTEDYFRVVGAKPRLGTVFSGDRFETGRDGVVLIGYGVWQERFGGDPEIVGRPLRINGRTRTVIGVMPAGFKSPAQAQFWVPRVFSPHEREDRDYKSLMVLGRLAEGVTADQGQTELRTIFAGLRDRFPEVLEGWDVSSRPTAEDVAGPLRPTFLMLLAAVATVLFLACLNVANLTLARGVRRRGELSVRSALGADRAAILRQLLKESLLLAAGGGLLGLLLAEGLLSALLAWAPPGFPPLDRIRLDGIAFAFTAGCCLATGVVFGVVPAWRLSRTDPVDALRGTGSRSTASVGWFRRAMVVVQVAAAMMVLVATGLLVRSLDRLLRQDLGFDPAHLMTARLELPPARYGAEGAREGFADEVLRRLSETPGVESAAATTFLPLQGWPEYIMRLEDNASIRVSEAPSTGYQGVSSDYFRTMGMTVLRGRGLSTDDREDTRRVVVVNLAFARRFFGDGDAIGKRIEVGFAEPPNWLEIVGVVSDAKGPSLEAQPREQVFVPLRQQPSLLRDNPALSLVVRGGGKAGGTAEAIRRAVWSVDRDQPVHLLVPMTQVVEAQAAQRRFAASVLTAFAVSALALAVLGLYGVVSGTVWARTREMGIRLALGSSRGRLLRWVLGHGVGLIALGVVLGTVGSLATARLLRSLLYQVQPVDSFTFLAVPALLCGVGLLACWLPARRAARLDPVVALRTE